MSGETTIGLSDSAAACLPAGSGYQIRYQPDVEETLNLFSVQIHCQHTVNPTLERKSATTFAVIGTRAERRDGPGAHSQSRG